ncbi:MAG TPA: ABC transporter permease [Candidatus Limnocylindrales bacterium]|nr:ABC transporter permease [Candidatus Limnocylindrales bacterium]
MKIKFRIKVTFFMSFFAVLLGLVAGAILMLATGSNPVEGFYYLFRGGLMNIERIGNSIASATPLILTGLSVAFAFKTGLFNIGGAGQMLIGGLCATAVGLSFAWPKPVLLTVIIFASMIGGGLWAALPGLLKSKFNVHEVVSTIMMNWIAFWTIFFVVPAYFKGPFLETESQRIPDAASLKVQWLTNLFEGSFINLGILLAVISVVITAFILEKTTLGYELKAVGYNRDAAKAAGINVNRNIILSMVIAGALAGLAGATFYVGFASNMQIGVLPSHGFDGIAVALLGANSPWGVLAAAFFFGLLHTGKGFMSAMTAIPPEIADTMIATIIYFAATSVLIERNWDKLKRLRAGAILRKAKQGSPGLRTGGEK